MSSFAGWAIGCAIASTIMSLALIVCAVGAFRDKQEKHRVHWGISAIVASVIVFCVFWPMRIEEHTETVTITGFGDTFWTKNQVHFTVNGEDHWVKLEEGQRDMYEMLIGKEVVLTYGKLHYIIPYLTPLETNEWRFGGIALPEQEDWNAKEG